MCSVAQSCLTLWGLVYLAHQSPLVKYTGMRCRFPLQGIFLTQGSNVYLLALAGRFFTTSANWETPCTYIYKCIYSTLKSFCYFYLFKNS